jgi:hypothetical protein
VFFKNVVNEIFYSVLKQIQNIQKSSSPMVFKSLDEKIIQTKNLRLFSNVCDQQKEI